MAQESILATARGGKRRSLREIADTKRRVSAPAGQWEATTRRNKIILFVPCDNFLGDTKTVLEEYYHVLRRWDTGRMSRVSYIWAGRQGYSKNKFEIEADDFANKNAQAFKECLDCKQKPK